MHGRRRTARQSARVAAGHGWDHGVTVLEADTVGGQRGQIRGQPGTDEIRTHPIPGHHQETRRAARRTVHDTATSGTAGGGLGKVMPSKAATRSDEAMTTNGAWKSNADATSPPISGPEPFASAWAEVRMPNAVPCRLAGEKRLTSDAEVAHSAPWPRPTP